MTRKTIEDLFIHSLSDIYGAQPCPAHRSHQTYPQRGGYAASLVSTSLDNGLNRGA